MLAALLAVRLVIDSSDMRFTPEQFNRIRLGMREEGVRAIMVVPPGDYSRSDMPIAMMGWCGSPSGAGHMWFWRDECSMICAGIDKERVIEKSLIPARPAYLRFFEKLARLIGR